MKLNNVKKSLKGGFSLVEMLVVIAVIGVITAIAVPAISGIIAEAKIAKNERNAQSAVSVYSAAVAAGATVASGIATAAITHLADGGVINDAENPFDGKSFSLDIAADEIDAAALLLEIDATSNLLVFQ